ncbi:sigma-70 family RNA polymerase sigma factor [Noviherbaspirillum sp. CPCC 100848]|uniref:Sigma-70 family RNA polymerase sigma factor n=1 Tax=Noviherbaspirillum album TaxID=3080276 RepID=A0ABU6JG49_9BURK|nr:sigma-70 family RNA polymerase sigma factor [Noviherbaspirillum sp. CPCC 100848]MEC4722627.1 sigma-70 family RNA polymerase sigma factor [Noviherbaspirillum sp. CPCC 100848]
MSVPLNNELEALRPALVRFAMLQLRNDAAAEDAVQETLVAVLEKPGNYAGRSSLRTYVTGILKHKILDAMRSNRREVQFDAAGGAYGNHGNEVNNGARTDADFIDALFRADGHVVDMPRPWGDPDAALEQKDFFRMLELCLEKLPPKTARIFMMREWLEMETPDICRELQISSSNAWVMLYRARLQLRECLDLNWFGEN